MFCNRIRNPEKKCLVGPRSCWRGCNSQAKHDSTDLQLLEELSTYQMRHGYCEFWPKMDRLVKSVRSMSEALSITTFVLRLKTQWFGRTTRPGRWWRSKIPVWWNVSHSRPSVVLTTPLDLPVTLQARTIEHFAMTLHSVIQWTDDSQSSRKCRVTATAETTCHALGEAGLVMWDFSFFPI